MLIGSSLSSAFFPLRKVNRPTFGKFPAMAASFDALGPVSPAVEFKKFQVSRDPFISPYLASDDLLVKFPPTHLLVSNLATVLYWMP